MKKYLVYVAIGAAALLLVVGVAGGAAWLIAAKVAPAAMVSKAAGAAQAEAEVQVTAGTRIELKEFVTNLADTDQKRYIKVQFELVGKDPKTTAALKDAVPVIRDTIVSVLNTKTAKEVQGVQGANTLKNDVLTKLNGVLTGKPIQKVLIIDFVVQ